MQYIVVTLCICFISKSLKLTVWVKKSHAKKKHIFTTITMSEVYLTERLFVQKRLTK